MGEGTMSVTMNNPPSSNASQRQRNMPRRCHYLWLGIPPRQTRSSMPRLKWQWCVPKTTLLSPSVMTSTGVQLKEGQRGFCMSPKLWRRGWPAMHPSTGRDVQVDQEYSGLPHTSQEMEYGEGHQLADEEQTQRHSWQAQSSLFQPRKKKINEFIIQKLYNYGIIFWQFERIGCI